MIRIYGYGGFAHEVAGAFQFNLMKEYIEIAGYIVDDKYFNNQPHCIPVSKYINDQVILAIGNPKVRKDIVERNKHIKFRSLNSGAIFSGSTFGIGTIIQPGTIITTNVHIGEFVIINLNCTVGHDSKIGSYTTISPGVNISGNVTIGEYCQIGSNAIIREKITICNNVIIGAGAVVVKDITEPGTYVGNPARKL